MIQIFPESTKLKVSIPYGKGKAVIALPVLACVWLIKYQFPMGKVKENKPAKPKAKVSYQFPMGKVKDLCLVAELGVFS